MKMVPNIRFPPSKLLLVVNDEHVNALREHKPLQGRHGILVTVTLHAKIPSGSPIYIGLPNLVNISQTRTEQS